MSERVLWTGGALAGVAYGALEIIGVIVGGVSAPAPYDIFPSAATAARVAATPMPTGVWLGFAIEVVATLFLIAFIVRAVVGAARPGGPGLIPTAALVAGTVNVAAVFVSFGVMAARNAGAGHGLDAQSVVLLSYLNWGTYFLSWPSMAVFLASLGIAAVQARSMPAWVAWSGIVISVAALVGCLDPVNLGQMAQLLQLVWVPVAGVSLALRRGAALVPKASMIPT